jgi:stage V sporulation protein S
MEQTPPTVDRDDVVDEPDVDLPPAADGQAPASPVPPLLKVSARSRPSAVAGAIAGVVRVAQRAEVHAIGAGATNQAVKALAIARAYLAADGIDMVCVPEFVDVVIGEEERTAIRFIVTPR